MKAPPNIVWIAICDRCGDVIAASRQRDELGPTCSICPPSRRLTARAYRCRLLEGGQYVTEKNTPSMEQSK